MTEKTTLVVYTCFTGDKEQLGDPLERLTTAETDLTLHFVCLSDKADLQSSRWQVIPFDTLGLPADKASRLPKARPHAFFSSISNYSLYVDNTVQFRRLPTSQDLKTTSPYLFKLFQHNGRKTILEEAVAIATLGYDTSSNLIEQLEHYAHFGPLKSITPLSTCTVILRDHSNPVIQRHGEFWWAQILAFTRRDQMSFDFSRIQTNCQVEYWPGNKHENDFVYPQENFSYKRVLANFDVKRYAWHHRNNQEAIASPKQHYLASNPTEADAIKFSRQDTISLDLLTYLFGSSLGGSVSPRRRIAEQAEKFIRAFMDTDASTGIGISINRNTDSAGFSTSDFSNTCKALQSLTKIHQFPTIDFDEETINQVAQPLSKILNVENLGIIFLGNARITTDELALSRMLFGSGQKLKSVIALISSSEMLPLSKLAGFISSLEQALAKRFIRDELIFANHDDLPYGSEKFFFFQFSH